MKKTLNFIIMLAMLATLALVACGGGAATQAPAATPAVQRPAPPADYANKKNPHAGDAASADAGKTVFQTNCSSCHGDKGHGDGPAAASLNPKPADLGANQAGLSDAYMFWRISEGGMMDPFKSAMPSWKGTLNEDQIWQVITYIRKLSGS